MHDKLAQAPSSPLEGKSIQNRSRVMPPAEAVDFLFRELDLPKPDRAAFLKVLLAVRAGVTEVGSPKEERNAICAILIEPAWKTICNWLSQYPESLGLSIGCDESFNPIKPAKLIAELSDAREEAIAEELRSHFSNTMTQIYRRWEKDLLASTGLNSILMQRLNVLKNSRGYESDVFEYQPISAGLHTAASVQFHALGQLSSTVHTFLGRSPTIEELRQVALSIPEFARELSRLPLETFDQVSRNMGFNSHGHHLSEYTLYDLAIVASSNGADTLKITFSASSLSAILNSRSANIGKTTGCPARFSSGTGQRGMMQEFSEAFLKVVDQVYLPLMSAKGIRAGK